jgi:diphosphomevalonate decarboxylase
MSHSSGEVKWSSPSNIAIVKYWGKYGNQLPRNPSISFTLSEAKSITTLKFATENKGSLRFFLDGSENEKFANRTKLFFNKISNILPWINDFGFEIHSSNTFPHSSGIASSASGMSAMAVCLLDIERILSEKRPDLDFQKASVISRLGSGSACRSVYPDLAVWGKHSEYQDSSDEFALGVGETVHPVFKTYHDDIAIISKNEKSVSSSAGHQLMEGNIYAESRYLQARNHLSDLKKILESGDVEAFGEIAEKEALVLHALMMSSVPSYILLEPDSIRAINKIRSFRADTKLPIYFTIDAGPNIHILYPDEIRQKAKDFIDQEIRPICENGLVISDHVGQGPQKLN